MVHWYPWAGESANGDSLLSQVRTKLPHMINGTTAGQDTGTNAGLRDTLAAHGIPDCRDHGDRVQLLRLAAEWTVDNPAESLFVADAYASWLGMGVTSVQYLEMLTKDFLNDSMTRGSAFYGVSMLDKLVEPGDSFVDATSTNNSVRAHAVLQDDGSLAVMILNTHLTETANVNFDLDGVTLQSNGLKYTLTGGTTMSAAVPTSDLGNNFSASLAPRSIATFIIPAVVTLDGDFNGDGTVDAIDYTIWRDGLGDDYTEDDYQVWKTNFGATLSGSGSTSSMSVPEPGSLALWLFGTCWFCLLAKRRLAIAERKALQRL